MSDPAPVQPLAIDGGPATFPAGAPAWPGDAIDASELRELFHSLIDDGSWAAYHGSHHDRLAQCVAELTDQPYVRLTSSGTVAVVHAPARCALRRLAAGRITRTLIRRVDCFGPLSRSTVANSLGPI